MFGDRTIPSRTVLGEGNVPLEWVVKLILDTGYRGPFDIEVIGPRLLAGGAEAGLKRSVAFLENAIQQRLAALLPGPVGTRLAGVRTPGGA